MALFDYECFNCYPGEVREVSHKMNETPFVPCQYCGYGMIKKISLPGIAFKGQGFYSTDSRPAPAPDTATTAKETIKP